MRGIERDGRERERERERGRERERERERERGREGEERRKSSEKDLPSQVENAFYNIACLIVGFLNKNAG